MASQRHTVMRTGQYADLTLPEYGESLIAPADGYFMTKLAGNETGDFSADVYRDWTYMTLHISVYSFGAYFLFFPVAAENTDVILNTTMTTVNLFQIYL